MPDLVFNQDEIDASGKGEVNYSGYLYVGRKYKDKEVVWIKLKKVEKNEL